MADNFTLIEAINYINSNTQNRNIIPGEIYQANPDKTYNVHLTTEQRIEGGETYSQEINIPNRKSENDLTYVVQDALGTSANLNIPVLLSCPNGDINRSTIKGLAQYNCPPNPTVYHMESVCFLAGTLVKTKHGDLPIEEIRRGMKIYSYNTKRNRVEPANVRKLIVHDKSEELITEYLLIKTVSSEVKVTKNHEFFDGAGYTPIIDILNFVYIYKEGKIETELILSKELIRCSPSITYNIELTGNSNKNYFASQYLVHNIGFGKY